MANVVNLRRARKAKARDAAGEAAEVARAAFGRTRAERAAGAMDIARRDRELDGARREP